MVGRAGAGALANVPRLNILHLNNISLVVAGLSTVLVTVLCTTYSALIVYAVVFGLSVGMHAAGAPDAHFVNRTTLHTHG